MFPFNTLPVICIKSEVECIFSVGSLPWLTVSDLVCEQASNGFPRAKCTNSILSHVLTPYYQADLCMAVNSGDFERKTSLFSSELNNHMRNRSADILLLADSDQLYYARYAQTQSLRPVETLPRFEQSLVYNFVFFLRLYNCKSLAV